MTSSVPRRPSDAVPEFGPLMPALVAPTTVTPPFEPDLAPARLTLATTLIAAAATARAALDAGDSAAAQAALARATWEAAWDTARGTVAGEVIAAARERLLHAAATARMSSRRTALVLPPASATAATALRIGVGATVLFQQLDRLETASRATDSGTGSVAAWLVEVERTARRVDESWRQLDEAVSTETAAWKIEAEAIAAWKPSPWLLRSGIAFVVAVCLLAGLMLGGWIAVPAPLRPIADRIWGLR